MADRPLRPATRRCLGGPLPHQQADRPRAPPEAKNHFLIGSCGPIGISGISTGFPVLSQSSGQVAHVLLTRSPLALHQYCYRMERVRLACVRHAASVRPEPGSNSPSRLTAGRATSKEAIRPNQESESRHALTRAWQQQARNLLQDSKACLLLYLTVNPSLSRRTGTERIARTGFWLSLFRFQGATGHTPIQPELVPGVPKDCSRRTATAGKSPSGAGRP